MENDPKAVANQLHEWFGNILRLTSESLFGIAPEGPHRDAVVLDVLKRNARILVQSGLDHEGKLYSPLCFFLAAASRKLGVALAVGHWRAAVDNVLHLEQSAPGVTAESALVGLEIDSPAAIVKQELDEAIRQASIAGGASYLSSQDRQVALGLAVHWGMRLLLAYALECPHAANGSGRRDLTWLAGLVEPLLSTSSPST